MFRRSEDRFRDRPRPGVVFAMRHSSDTSYVWTSLARTYDLAAEFLGSEAECYLAYPQLSRTPAYQPRRLQPIEVDFYCNEKSYRPKLAAATARYNVRSVVYMNAPASQVAARSLRRWGVRTINGEQDQLRPAPRQSGVRRLLKHVLRARLGIGLHDAHVAVSQHGRQYLLGFAGFPAKRVYTVLNGVDAAHFCPGAAPEPESFGLPRSDLYAVSVCQARPEKRGDFLVEVARRVFAARPQLSLTFVHVGGGPCAEQWQATAHSLGLEERFRFIPAQRDAAPFHRLASMLVHAAERENLPFAVLEAMAAGKPVVASRIPGTAEVVQHGDTGFLVDLPDADGFAQAVLRLADDPELRIRQGDAGRQHILQHYTIQQQARQLSDVIRQQLPLDGHSCPS